MQCIICLTNFEPKVHNAMYCSQKCKSKATYLKSRKKTNKLCIICGKPTPNPKFCSRTCSASVSRKCQPKPKFCHQCGIKISDKWTHKKLCTECSKNRTQAVNRFLTLSELKTKLSTSQYHAAIRMDARTIYKPTGICTKCGYDKHTNVCHIKPIHKFPMDTLVSDVNNLTNLTELCPNCHWEFDHK